MLTNFVHEAQRFANNNIPAVVYPPHQRNCVEVTKVHCPYPTDLNALACLGRIPKPIPAKPPLRARTTSEQPCCGVHVNPALMNAAPTWIRGVVAEGDVNARLAAPAVYNIIKFKHFCTFVAYTQSKMLDIPVRLLVYKVF